MQSPTSLTRARRAHGPFSPRPSARTNSKPNTATTYNIKLIHIHISLIFGGIPIDFEVTYGEIQSNKKGSSSAQSNSRAIASALADSTTHLVIRIQDKGIANRQPGQPLAPLESVRSSGPPDAQAQGQPGETQDQYERRPHHHCRQKVCLAPLRHPDGRSNTRL
eukprot:scaffold12962_cov135-Isochrysis_galbana.AAC.6